jgi:hypothetical protein
MLFLNPFEADICRKATHGRVINIFLVMSENECDTVEREERRGIYSISSRP